ncbi:flagellar motor switch protein FliG [Paracoccus sp. M683]|uniref:FliG C-terminal domain-containing protein n=1 Tax=Paracoccus sp. M683 TaxID=2594268 RepID=UPI00117C32EF|nr:FliG C-terminal domain-containing protein [Paracoccus sp. M683]TRW97265.1 flagellar motor switch protein FliG [Paracoccus sp. M683]
MAHITVLSPRQKAAVIVKLLLDGQDELPLSALNDEAQTLLAQEMAAMQLIDRTTRDAVIGEFCDSLERIGVTFPGDLDSTLDILGQQLSVDATDRLRRVAALSGQGDPWDRIGALPADKLVMLACNEAVEIAALMFSKLPVSKASEVFGKLPRERARAVALAMSMTGDVTRAALHRVGLILLQAADALPRPAIDSPAVERVGAILNFATADLRDAILEGLDQDDAQFAGGVRKTLFTFRHIPSRVEVRDIPRIVRDIDNNTLIRALAGAKDEDAQTTEFILSNLPQRLAENLRGEIETAGTIRPRDAEIAMTEVVAAIRALADSGDLDLILPSNGGEEAA